MNIHYAFKRAYLRSYHTFYQLVVLAFINNIGSDYIVKLQYNRDKDLVYAYRPGLLTTYESVYETHHLEQ